MIPTLRTGLLFALIGLLTVVAVVGWTRNPAPAFAANGYAQPVGYGQSAYYGTTPPPLPAAAPAYYDGNAPYVANNGCPEPDGYRPVAYQPQDTIREVRTYREPARVVRTRYVEPSRTYVTNVHRGRSWKKSAAIVAGTGGVGAAIGALAGGGRGAAIGALTGGGAGFLYDRLTHNKVN